MGGGVEQTLPLTSQTQHVPRHNTQLAKTLEIWLIHDIACIHDNKDMMMILMIILHAIILIIMMRIIMTMMMTVA